MTEKEILKEYSNNLHSNMELLLLLVMGFTGSKALQFTFQYGATAIDIMQLALIKNLEFTFQYGATAIEYFPTILLISSTFTFQYGATAIVIPSTPPPKEKAFTFQYGATAILKPKIILQRLLNLHSNMELLLCQASKCFFL